MKKFVCALGICVLVYLALSIFNVIAHNLPGTGTIAAWNFFNILR